MYCMAFEIDGMEHVFERDSCECECSCHGSLCPRCNARVHVQGGFMGMIEVCEQCDFDLIEPTLKKV